MITVKLSAENDSIGYLVAFAFHGDASHVTVPRGSAFETIAGLASVGIHGGTVNRNNTGGMPSGLVTTTVAAPPPSRATLMA